MDIVLFFHRLLYKAAYKVLYVYWFLFRPHTQGGAQIMIIHEGKYFLIRHTYKNYGKYDFVGGGKNGNETKDETMARELKEETGLLPLRSRYIGEFAVEGEFHSGPIFIYVVEPDSKEVHLQASEIEGGEWYAEEEVWDKLSPFSQRVWQQYMENKGE